jgi:UTP:GlnB (protein PII) uridylyltransferase
VSPLGALSVLAEHSLANSPDQERVHVYDALASVARALAPSGESDGADTFTALAESAEQMATRLRDLDRSQTDFLSLLS